MQNYKKNLGYNRLTLEWPRSHILLVLKFVSIFFFVCNTIKTNTIYSNDVYYEIN